MCGFAGVVAWSDRYRTSREVLARMSGAVAHRGPDGEGIYFNHEGEVGEGRPQVGMAFRRLAILDPDPRAMQPFHLYDDGGRVRLSMVFNGEIYNFRELRKELEGVRPGYAWRTTGDTEVLLVAYDVWGERCVEKLNGMFAFVVWDEGAGSLFLARDRMGQKPLYVAFVQDDGAPARDLNYHYPRRPPRAIAFASELSALRALAWPDFTTDDGGLGWFLTTGYTPADVTIYRGVRRVRPGHWMRATASGEGVASYWTAEPKGTTDDTTAARQTRELMTRAVGRQLVSDVPLGCFLSGGVDSSVVAACMKASVPTDQPVLTFSIGFEDARYDETRYAAAVAKHLGTTHHQFVVKPDAANDLPKLAEVYGEPFGDSSALPTHYLSHETRRHVKVALSGDGGDELFAGYDRYRAIRLERFLGRIPRSLRAVLAGHVADQLRATHPKSSVFRTRRFLKSVHLSAAERYASYVRLFDAATIHSLLQPQLLESSRRAGEELVGLLEVALMGQDPVRAAMRVDQLYYLPDDLLTKVDRASMLHNLEVRSPFMDPDVVTFAAGLTVEQLLKGGGKRMLREAFAGDLPGFVFKRRKMGFAVPIGEWFRGSLRSMLHDHLFASGSFASGHFNLDVVRRLVREHEEERVDHSQRLYALLMLELWWRLQR